MVNKNIHLFLIPMPFCTFLCFRTFVLSFESSCMPFFLNFFIQAPLSIVSFCVRCIWLSAHEQRINLAVLYFNDSILCFGTYCFHRSFFTLICLFGFQFLAWDHLYIIYCLPCFLSMGILLSPPRKILNVRWMEPRNSITDFWS